MNGFMIEAILFIFVGVFANIFMIRTISYKNGMFCW